MRGVAAKGEGKTDNAAERQAAFSAAPVALRRLMRRLTAASDHRRLPGISARTARSLVQGLEIISAKRLDGPKGRRFDGVLSFLFDEQKVGVLLDTWQIAWSARRAAPLLVLPVWRDGAQTILWDGDNPWRDVWEGLKIDPGLVPVLLPDGTLKDLQAIDGAQATRRDAKALAAIAGEYEAAQVLVAIAANTKGRLSVRAAVFTVKSSEITELRPVVRRGERAMEAAIKELVGRIEARWKARVIVPAGPVQATTVLIRFSDIEAWARIQDSLEATPVVTGHRVLRFSAGKAQVSLSHRGSVDNLPRRLRSAGLILKKEGSPETRPVWVMQEIPSRAPKTE